MGFFDKKSKSSSSTSAAQVTPTVDGINNAGSSIGLGNFGKHSNVNINVTDAGALADANKTAREAINKTSGAAEKLTELALDSMTNGAASAFGFSKGIASMAFDAIDKNNRQTHAAFFDVLSGVKENNAQNYQAVESIIGGVKENNAQNYQAVESIIAEKATSGDQQIQKYLITAVGVIGAMMFLMMGAKR